jgi:hypothetical protein
MERKKDTQKKNPELHSEVSEKTIGGIYFAAASHMKKKTLLQIDPVYNNVSEFMSTIEKIAYCERLVLETEQFLGISAHILETKSKDRYFEIIEAAKEEMIRLKDLL